ncbi:DUF1826 domain-containing protein [uncultured Amphritea sp.]|uniref:DUF1826 domain-containing protein n=1 Tax=uncultured Amphritea sp. TaxID=981605 RepID=UPI00262EF140|nr:DUF1826 domain-containing protein [uncultured Amphritea sp.]
MNATELEISQTGYIGSGEQSYASGLTPEVMTKIYQEQINLVVLQRMLATDVSDYCQMLVESKPGLNFRSVLTPEKAVASLRSSLPDLQNQSAFIDDIVLLLEMYSCLFELDEVGVRLQVLDRAMCPRFHTDKLGCRLVSTFLGPGTEWLHNCDVNRSKLGPGNMGLSDDESGLFSSAVCIQQVNPGDIVLLKGDGWYGNDGLGAVHRSPAVFGGEKRIVVTMDFA